VSDLDYLGSINKMDAAYHEAQTAALTARATLLNALAVFVVVWGSLGAILGLITWVLWVIT